MEPTLSEGDFLVAIRIRPDRLTRGRIVVVEHPERPGFEIVKRLAGLPGDGVDGVTMADGEYWVVGDDPAESTDSRSFGPVPAGAIRGVVRWRYWPIRTRSPRREA